MAEYNGVATLDEAPPEAVSTPQPEPSSGGDYAGVSPAILPASEGTGDADRGYTAIAQPQATVSASGGDYEGVTPANEQPPDTGPTTPQYTGPSVAEQRLVLEDQWSGQGGPAEPDRRISSDPLGALRQIGQSIGESIGNLPGALGRAVSGQTGLESGRRLLRGDISGAVLNQAELPISALGALGALGAGQVGAKVVQRGLGTIGELAQRDGPGPTLEPGMNPHGNAWDSQGPAQRALRTIGREGPDAIPQAWNRASENLGDIAGATGVANAGLNVAGDLLLDPINLAAFGVFNRAPGVIGSAARLWSGANNAPFQGLNAAMAKAGYGPIATGAAGIGGLGALGMVPDTATGKPLGENLNIGDFKPFASLHNSLSNMPVGVQMASGLLVPLAAGLGLATAVRAGGAGLGKLTSGAEKFVPDLAKGVELVNRQGVFVRDLEPGKPVPSGLRLATPAETIKRPWTLDAPGPERVQDTAAIALAQLRDNIVNVARDNPMAAQGMVRALVDLPKTASAADLAAAANRVRVGTEPNEAFTAAMFENPNMRVGVNLLQDALEPLVGRGQNVTMEGLIQTVMRVNGGDAATAMGKLTDYARHQFDQRMGYGNPVARDVTRAWPMLMRDMQLDPTLRNAIMNRLSPVEKQLLTPGSPAFSRMEYALQDKLTRFGEIKRLDALLNHAKNAAAGAGYGQSNKLLPVSLDPAMRKFNQDPFLRLMNDFKVVSSQFWLGTRPGYHVNNFIGDSARIIHSHGFDAFRALRTDTQDRIIRNVMGANHPIPEWVLQDTMGDFRANTGERNLLAHAENIVGRNIPKLSPGIMNVGPAAFGAYLGWNEDPNASTEDRALTAARNAALGFGGGTLLAPLVRRLTGTDLFSEAGRHKWSYALELQKASPEFYGPAYRDALLTQPGWTLEAAEARARAVVNRILIDGIDTVRDSRWYDTTDPDLLASNTSGSLYGQFAKVTRNAPEFVEKWVEFVRDTMFRNHTAFAREFPPPAAPPPPAPGPTPPPPPGGGPPPPPNSPRPQTPPIPPSPFRPMPPGGPVPPTAGPTVPPAPHPGSVPPPPPNSPRPQPSGPGLSPTPLRPMPPVPVPAGVVSSNPGPVRTQMETTRALNRTRVAETRARNNYVNTATETNRLFPETKQESDFAYNEGMVLAILQERLGIAQRFQQPDMVDFYQNALTRVSKGRLTASASRPVADLLAVLRETEKTPTGKELGAVYQIAEDYARFLNGYVVLPIPKQFAPRGVTTRQTVVVTAPEAKRITNVLRSSIDDAKKIEAYRNLLSNKGVDVPRTPIDATVYPVREVTVTDKTGTEHRVELTSPEAEKAWDAAKTDAARRRAVGIPDTVIGQRAVDVNTGEHGVVVGQVKMVGNKGGNAQLHNGELIFQTDSGGQYGVPSVNLTFEWAKGVNPVDVPEGWSRMAQPESFAAAPVGAALGYMSGDTDEERQRNMALGLGLGAAGMLGLGAWQAFFRAGGRARPITPAPGLGVFERAKAIVTKAGIDPARLTPIQVENRATLLEAQTAIMPKYVDALDAVKVAQGALREGRATYEAGTPGRGGRMVRPTAPYDPSHWTPDISAKVTRAQDLMLDYDDARVTMFQNLRSNVTEAEARAIFDAIPDAHYPQWKMPNGDEYHGPVLQAADASFTMPDGTPLTHTNSYGHVLDTAMGNHVELLDRWHMKLLQDGVMWAASADPKPGTPGVELPRATHNQVINQARMQIGQTALERSMAELLNYSSRNQGQMLLDHAVPYSFWLVNSMAHLGRYLVQHPGQYAVLATLLRDWHEQTEDLPPSYRWTLPVRMEDGGVYTFRPQNMLPYGVGSLLEYLGPERRNADWLDEIGQITGLGGGVHWGLDLGRQYASTKTNGAITQAPIIGGLFPKGPGIERATDQFSQFRLMRQKSGGLSDPERGLRSLIYGTDKLGIDENYYVPMKLAEMVNEKKITEQQALAAMRSNKEGKPNALYQSVMKAALDEQGNAGMIRFAGAPISYLSPERMRLDKLGKQYGAVAKAGGKAIGAFMEQNPDLGVKFAANDQAWQIRKSADTGAYFDAVEATNDQYRKDIDALRNQFIAGAISQQDWKQGASRLQSERDAALVAARATNPYASTQPSSKSEMEMIALSGEQGRLSDYLTANKAISAKYDAKDEALSNQFVNRTISGTDWRSAQTANNTAKRAEQDALTKKYEDVINKLPSSGDYERGVKSAFDQQASDLARQLSEGAITPDIFVAQFKQIEAERDAQLAKAGSANVPPLDKEKALSGYYDIKAPALANGKVDFDALGTLQKQYLQSLPEAQRNYIVAETQKPNTRSEQYYQTTISPLIGQYASVPRYLTGTPAEHERWDKAYEIYGDQYGKAIDAKKTPKEANAIAIAAVVKAGYKEADVRNAQDDTKRNPEKPKLFNSPEMAPYRQYLQDVGKPEPKAKEIGTTSGTTTRGTGTGTAGAGSAATRATDRNAVNALWDEYRELQSKDKSAGAEFYAINFDKLYSLTAKDKIPAKPDIAATKQRNDLFAQRKAILDKLPPSSDARGRALFYERNAATLNRLNEALGLPTRYSTSSSLNGSPLARPVTPPRSGGGGSSGGARPAPSSPVNTNLKNFLSAAGSSFIQHLRNFWDGKVNLTDEDWVKLRRLRSKFPFAQGAGVSDAIWLREVRSQVM